MEKHAQKCRDRQITAFALGMLTLFLFSASYLMFGIGTLPATMTAGLGLFPYLGGTFFSFVAFGLLVATAGFSASALYHSHQEAVLYTKN